MARRWTPRLWASRKPFGMGEQRPNNYLEIARAIRGSWRRLPYAWRILDRGVCDGCALGTTGMRDWTLEGTHLCSVRLRLLPLNTMGPLDPAALADAGVLRGRSATELRELGRLPFPLRRRRGESGFARVGWDEALDLAAARIGAGGARRVAAFLTSRGMPNESYYVAQKAMRAIGTNSIDNAARVCHSPSTFGLKESIGVGASTCSYRDWIGTDLIVFVGANPANNQPVAMKYLHHARKEGTSVVCINPYEEPGMARYWIPSVPESALFGTRITERFFTIDTGGDVPFLLGTLRHLIERGWVDREFVERHTTGFDDLSAALGGHEWEALERGAGVSRGEMLEFARMLGEARNGVFVWSMGTTQHVCGEDTVRAIVDVALARGWVGRELCGLMPIRGHSGVQGGAEMGCYSTAFPGGDAISPSSAGALGERWGFEVPREPGLTAPEMIDAAHAGELDVLVAAGGNFLEVLPDPPFVEEALASIPLRVHLDLVLSPQMLVEPAEDVLVLPAKTRYEIEGGVTETSTERRIIFSPEIPGPRIGEARAEWEVFGELAARARPERAADTRFASTRAIREEIARVVPLYAGIETLHERGDQVQYGGARLCEGPSFPTPDGRARFAVVAPPPDEPDDGRLRLSTRRGKQFNSMVQGRRDAITGAERGAVLLAGEDVAARGLADGAPVLVRSDFGELRGRVLVAPVKPGNVQVHWPEGNVLLDRTRRSAEAGVPDYNVRVSVEPLP